MFHCAAMKSRGLSKPSYTFTQNIIEKFWTNKLMIRNNLKYVLIEQSISPIPNECVQGCGPAHQNIASLNDIPSIGDEVREISFRLWVS